MPEQFASVPYLKIPSLGIEKIIKEEMGKDILDHYYIGIWNQEKDIRKIGHLILAGHNVKNVFGNLYKINIGDLIYIYDRSEEYIYEVTEKKEIGVTETEYLKGTKKRSVSLITCTKDDQVRLYVHAKIKRA